MFQEFYQMLIRNCDNSQRLHDVGGRETHTLYEKTQSLGLGKHQVEYSCH